MKTSLIRANQFSLTDLNNDEQKQIFGGDRVSKNFFFYLGVAFEYLDRAAVRGAPPTRQQFR